MIRFIWTLVLALGVTTAAHADVLELLKAGLAARSSGDFDGAIYYYTQAIATGELTKPYLATVLNSRGVAYEVKGDADKAMADFDAAIQLKPDYGEAYYTSIEASHGSKKATTIARSQTSRRQPRLTRGLRT